MSWAAVARGQPDLLRSLIAAGGQPTRDCLCDAAQANNMEMVQLVVAAGVPVAGSGAVAAAAHEGHVRMVVYLLNKGADPDEQYCDMPGLVIAACSGDLATMRVLLAAGADVDIEPDSSEFSRPLAECSSAEAARLLLAAGAVFQDPASGFVALVHLAAQGCDEALSVLLEAGAPVWCSGPFRSWSSLSSFSCFSPAARARRCRVIICGCRIGAIRCSGKSASS